MLCPDKLYTAVACWETRGMKGVLCATFTGRLRVASNYVCADLRELALFWLKARNGFYEIDGLRRIEVYELDSPVLIEDMGGAKNVEDERCHPTITSAALAGGAGNSGSQ